MRPESAPIFAGNRARSAAAAAVAVVSLSRGVGFRAEAVAGQGRRRAFAGALDRPPSTSYEIMNPAAYEQGKNRNYCICRTCTDARCTVSAVRHRRDGRARCAYAGGVIGGKQEAATMTPQWKGGLYYAAQRGPGEDSAAASRNLLAGVVISVSMEKRSLRAGFRQDVRSRAEQKVFRRHP